MPQTLHYTVDPFDLAGHRLRITLHIPRVANRDQIIFAPAWIPGSYLIRDFSRHIESIRGMHDGKWHTPEKIDSHHWVFRRCHGSLSVEIVVYAWDLSVRGAHVDQSHVFFNGTSVFLGVKGLESKRCTVDIKRPTGKRNWRAYSSMPLLKSYPNGKLMGRYVAPNYDALIDHPFELGTPQVVEFDACGAPHKMIFSGYAPNLDLQRIKHDAQKICESQIRLFEPDRPKAPFLDSADHYLFMTTVTPDGYGGLEHRASTALVASRKDLPTLHQQNPPHGYTTFLGLVSHEYFHTWHVKRIKPAAFVPYDLSKPNHTQLLWVFEGFTSYYDDLMLLRSGVIDLAAYLSLLSKTITTVHSAPGRFKQSLADSSFDAWTKYYKQDENAPNTISSYYAKGSLVALGLDLTIRIKSKDRYSLDDVMRALWRKFGLNFYKQSQTGLGEAELAKLIRTTTAVDVSGEIDQWVTNTEDVPLQSLLAQAGFAMRWMNKDQMPALGATFKPLGEFLTVRHVIEGGEAHRAGLSSADVLLAIDDLRVGNSLEALKSILATYKTGSVVTLHTFRADVLRSVRLRISAPQKSTCEIHPINGQSGIANREQL